LVLDTNVFMQCELFTRIDWRKEHGRDQIRLVVPMIVLDEIDDKTLVLCHNKATRINTAPIPTTATTTGTDPTAATPAYAARTPTTTPTTTITAIASAATRTECLLIRQRHPDRLPPTPRSSPRRHMQPSILPHPARVQSDRRPTKL
jgi:hypothetical protein